MLLRKIDGEMNVQKNAKENDEKVVVGPGWTQSAMVRLMEEAILKKVWQSTSSKPLIILKTSMRSPRILLVTKVVEVSVI